MSEENNEVSAKEAYDAKKAEREAKREKRHRKEAASQASKKWIFIVLGVIALGLVVYGLSLLGGETAEPAGEDFSQAVEIMPSREHIPLDSEIPEYNSNPPTSGAHYADPARTGFRGDTDIADGHYIHTLEHGNVWISYHPDVSEEVIEGLRQFAGIRVAVSEREANGQDIALAAWGRLDTFDVGQTLTEADLQRIGDFIIRYVDFQAPERLPTSAHSQGV